MLPGRGLTAERLPQEEPGLRLALNKRRRRQCAAGMHTAKFGTSPCDFAGRVPVWKFWASQQRGAASPPNFRARKAPI